MLMKLSKKVQYEYKEKNENGEIETKQREYAELEFNLDDLTGKNLIAADTNARKVAGEMPFVPALSPTYQAAVIAQAAKVPLEVILDLNAPDFTALTLMAQNFLLETGLKD